MSLADELAGIEPGDSNEVCLAKTMLAMAKPEEVNEMNLFFLLEAGEKYANEVLDARE